MARAGRKLLGIIGAGALALAFAFHAECHSAGSKKTGALSIRLGDAFGNAVSGKSSVTLCHRSMPDCLTVAIPAGQPVLRLSGLPAGKEKYEVTVRSSGYKSFKTELRLKPDEQGAVDARLRLAASAIGSVQFPDYDSLPPGWREILERSGAVETFPGLSGRRLYDALGARPKASLLNILAKSAVTPLPDGSILIHQLHDIMRIHDDRVYFATTPLLDTQMRLGGRTGLFNTRGSFKSMLHDPFKPFKKTGSYKTPNRHATLNLEMYSDGRRYMGEVDIDEFSGFIHAFEVSRNVLFGMETNPFTIGQLLMVHQRIDPLYRLQPAPR